MASPVKLPPLGEGVEEATVVEVLVSEGDEISEDQDILRMETDKATFEVPSPKAGTITEIKVGKGDTVGVGDEVLSIDSGEDGGEEKDQKEKKKEEKGERKEEKKKQKKEDKASKQEADDEAGGREPRDDEKGRSEDEQPTPAAGVNEAEQASGIAKEEPDGEVTASPNVQRRAEEMGIDLEDVEGSGPHGRVVMADLDDMAGGEPGDEETERAAGVRAARETLGALPDFSEQGQVERRSLSRVRRRTAERMAAIWASVPHVTLFDEADVTGIEKTRRGYEERAEGRSISVTALLTKVVAAGLRAFPDVNSSLDMDSGELIVKRFVNVGVAVDTEAGLMVPVIRDADKKGIMEISGELADLAEQARGDGLPPDAMRGATFTLTNLGGVGIGRFTPIVNWPEVAILGVGRASERTAGEGAESRLVMPLSLSIDHRALDGADGARFLRWVVEALEEPLRVPMEA
jgi:pyruvate dehydrogenase E2 component (dihydrolipoamide acetyltransferase)